MKKFFSGLVFCMMPVMLWAHGDVHERIHLLSHQLKEHASDVSLYIERGRLYMDDQDYLRAERDFKQVLQRVPDNREVCYYLAKSLLARNEAMQAERYARQFLEVAENETLSEAVLMRGNQLLGEIAAQRKLYKDAARYYRLAIAYALQPEPGLYLAAAAADAHDHYFARDLRILEQGLQKLGPLLVLENAALRYELDAGLQQDALSRMSGVLLAQQDNPFLCYEYGMLLKEYKLQREARGRFEEALGILDGVPAHRQQFAVFLKLRDQIQNEVSAIQ